MDSLRCPAAHEESWLVVMVHDAVDATLLRADLACPVCGAEYEVRDGLAQFVAAAEPASTQASARIMHDLDLSRLAALLGMTESTQSALLIGAHDATGVQQASMQIGERLPLGAGTIAAAALDEAHATPTYLAEAVRVVRQGGRIVAPATAPLPDGVRELARDETEWVAEVTARASGLIELRRRAPEIID
ncbi:MAG: hypothetical protein IBJ03_00205 [Gemmatimonadaceae bacterium]|nr:hypothetical protein [Gemmatimonadaceae bacterium]